MSSCFAVNERKPQTQMTPAFTPARPALQRKCACGGQCSSCQSRKNPGGQIFHNFGDVAVHTQSETQLIESSFPFRLSETENGDTGCDVSKGIPDITLNKPSPCFKDCTVRHEGVHKKDIEDCCKKSNKAWAGAKDEKAKDDVQTKMNQWVLTNQLWLECRAYAESVKCAEEFLKANCGAKKAATDEAVSPEVNYGVGDYPSDDMPKHQDQGREPEPRVMAEQEVLTSRLGEDKPGRRNWRQAN